MKPCVYGAVIVALPRFHLQDFSLFRVPAARIKDVLHIHIHIHSMGAGLRREQAKWSPSFKRTEDGVGSVSKG